MLNAHLVASKTEFAAYDAKTVMLAANIERQSNIIWRKKWTWSVGTELIATDERGMFMDPAQRGDPHLPHRRFARDALL